MDIIPEIDVENFHGLIENYEFLIKDLTGELDFFRTEHADLNTRIKSILDENRTLSERVDELIQQNAESAASDYDGQLMENLKEQLNLIINEKEVTTNLWQSAIETIDRLEEELKIYQNQSELVPKKELSKTKLQFEEKLKELEHQLESTKQKHKENQKISSDEIHMKNAEVNTAICNQTNTLKIIKNLEDEILYLQDRLDVTTRNKTELEKKIIDQNLIIESLNFKNAECTTKVSEAVLVLEDAFKEKSEALKLAKEAKEETEKLSKTLSEVVDETQLKVKREVELVKAEYNSKLKKILIDLKETQEDIKQKETDADDYAKRCKHLEAEIERITKGNLNLECSNTSKLLILEKNLETTFQKLLISEKQNIVLQAEIERMKNDNDQMYNIFDNDVKTRDVEKGALQNKIQMLQTELNESNNKYTQVQEKMQKLDLELRKMEKDFNEEIANREKQLHTTHSQKLKKIDCRTKKDFKELEQQLKSQIELNERWRTETKSMVERFAKQIINLKNLVKKLKKKNTDLKERLKKDRRDNNEIKSDAPDSRKSASRKTPTTKKKRLSNLTIASDKVNPQNEVTCIYARKY